MFGITWHQLTVPLRLLQVIKFCNKLRQKNLNGISQLPNQDKLLSPDPRPDNRHLVTRTLDGSYNDLEHPEMGMSGTALDFKHRAKTIAY